MAPDGPQEPIQNGRVRVALNGRGPFEVATDRGSWRCDGVVPGEHVRIRPRAGGSGFADLIAVEEPSPARRSPSCALAAHCGGCQWLHIEEAEQSAIRLRELDRALGAAGVLLPPADARRHVPSAPLAYRCRARFQAHVGGRGLALGFHRAGGRRTVDVPLCPLLAPPLAFTYACLRALLPTLPCAGLTGLEITALPGAPGALVWLNPRDRPPASWRALGEALLTALPGTIAGVATRDESQGATAIVGRTPAGHPIAAAARGFVQAHLEGADALAEEVARAAEAGTGPHVVELFAGSGLLGWRMALRGARVVAIERDPLAVAAAALLPAPENGSLTWLAAQDARTAWRAARGADVLVADPPRSGLGALAEELTREGPARLVLVSCSVRTLARDLALLTREHYALRAMTTLDLFPQTRHLEVVVTLERRRESG